MKNKKLNKGFSLLELLVVILIIGVIAAIALPQYQKAVWKSRAANLYTQIVPIGSAIQRYYMVHNTWVTDFNDIDIDIPIESTTGTKCVMDFGGYSLKEGEGFALKIQGPPTGAAAYALFTKGPYRCAGFGYYPPHDITGSKLFCVEIIYQGNFHGQRGDFCEKVMGYSYLKTSGQIDWFTK